MILLAGIVTIQALAYGAQIASGFRPFGAPPGRVPFSWDMFAGRIERCDLRWTPSLPLGDGVSRLRDVAPALEWDPVHSRRESYRKAGQQGCDLAETKARVTLRCFTPEGEIVDAFDCR